MTRRKKLSKQLLKWAAPKETPFDEGVQAYIDGDGPEIGDVLYRRGTESNADFARGWLSADKAYYSL